MLKRIALLMILGLFLFYIDSEFILFAMKNIRLIIRQFVEKDVSLIFYYTYK